MEWLELLIISTLIGSALIGGIFFAFSTFIMKALAEIPSAEGIRAMQSINIVVINPIVMGALFGTALMSLVVAVLSFTILGGFLWLTSGALTYVIGTFLVTALGNVPLNNQLAKVSADEGEQTWSHYLNKWTMLNHIRTIAAIAAAVLLTIGLINL